MEAEAILDMADRATRHVRKRHNLNLSYDDFLDARQEAAAGRYRAEIRGGAIVVGTKIEE